MQTQDFNTSFQVDQDPQDVYNNINNVRGWWSQNIIGSTDQVDEVFTYQHKENHKCSIKVIELVPGKKIAWLVLDNYFDFTNDKSEWIGTRIEFDITRKENQTEVKFTHRGLVPANECYEVCRDAWTNYIQKSLCGLITTGKGQPNPKEG
jgi:hypothetical protein